MKQPHDAIWLLIGALLCFVTSYLLSLKGCDTTLITVIASGGVSAIGALGGISSSSRSTSKTTTTENPAETKTETTQ